MWAQVYKVPSATGGTGGITLGDVPANHPSPADPRVAARLPEGPVLVTGAAGFLGGAVVRRCVAAGHPVCALVRPAGTPMPPTPGGVDVAIADVRDAEALRAVLHRVRPALVVHTAATAGHPRDVAARHDAWHTNVFGTVALLEAIASFHAGGGRTRLVQVGSGTEYAPSHRPHREPDIGLPVTVRGVTKLAATLAVRQWAVEGGHDAVVVRPFSIYGPGEPATKLVPTLLRCALDGDPFPMLDAESRRDLVHVDDVAEGCLRAAAVASPDAPVLNLGTGVEHTVDEVRRVVEDVTGRPVHVGPVARPAQAHDAPHWVADTSVCRALLGWSPATALRDGIAGMLAAQGPGR